MRTPEDYNFMRQLNILFQNHWHQYGAITATTAMGRLSTRLRNLDAPNKPQEHHQLTTDIGRYMCDMAFQYTPKVLDGLR